jgi:hypothetical protein
VRRFEAKAESRGAEANMNDLGTPTRLPVNVREALEAIGAYGKGRCWYCDARLPAARTAIRQGWDVQRVDGQPVASIILVCPACLRGKPDPPQTALNPLLPPSPSGLKPKPSRSLARSSLQPRPTRA